MMQSIFTCALAALSISSLARAQSGFGEDNNVTTIEGTWSSGSGAVQTGGSFCMPAQDKFTYPTNTGISYSFTDDGFFEEAQYRYTSNATNPACIQATIFWQHGTYTFGTDGSITLTPFGTDGRIQVQNPCAAVTNVITYYNQVTLYSDWGITVDTTTSNYMLRLNRFDGAKMPPMYLVARPPNMLPTGVLTGVNASGQTQTRKRSTINLDTRFFKRSAASPRTALGKEMVVLGGVLGSLAVVGGSLMMSMF